MEKTRQQILIHWLKQQSTISRFWINISCLLGLVGAFLTIAQTWVITNILQYVIEENILRKFLLLPLMMLFLIFIFRALIGWLREKVNFYAGCCVRREIRHQLLNKIEQISPVWIQSRPTGSWITLIVEQIDSMHDYYSNYLPQIILSGLIPLLIAITIFFKNWVVGIIFLFTGPLVPLFMVWVGMNAAEENRRNFLELSRLSSYFLDRLRGMETLRIFNRSKKEIENIRLASENFRRRTMEVLRIAFLSSGVLEFFISLSIALIAMYFGFSYLGVLNFGYYDNTILTLSTGLFMVILAPEFFQPLRDLGTFYHAKAKAIGGADSLKTFFETSLVDSKDRKIAFNQTESLTLVAENFSILSPDRTILAGPLNFTLLNGQRVALIGLSGSGKSSLLNALAGFMDYKGSLRINGIELRSLKLEDWQSKLSWMGQNPQFLSATLRENILLGRLNTSEDELRSALDQAWVSEFLPILPNGIKTMIGDQGAGLSVGQAQRVALARALLHPCHLMLLDEPTASLDTYSEKRILQALEIASRRQTTLMVTHHLKDIIEWDSIWLMDNGKIIEQGNFTMLTSVKGQFSSLLTKIIKNDSRSI